MSAFDPNDYVTKIDQAQTTEDVDAVFAEITKLDAPQQKQVLDTIETLFTDNIQKGAPSASEKAQAKMVISLVEKIKDTPQGQFMMASFEQQVMSVREGVLLGQVALNVHNIRGESAAPAIKAYVEAAAKISDEDYNSAFGQLRLMIAVSDRLDEGETPAPSHKNPFRRGGPSGPA